MHARACLCMYFFIKKRLMVLVNNYYKGGGKCNSLMTIRFLQQKGDDTFVLLQDPFPLLPLLQEVRISHVYSEGNSCADIIANRCMGEGCMC